MTRSSDSAGNEIRSKVSPSFWRPLPSQDIFHTNLRLQNAASSLFPLINNHLHLIVMAKKNNTQTTEPVADCNQLSIVPIVIERRIYVVRDTQVMIDLDLATLYGVENRSLRQTVRRNIDSFPDDFMFRLTNQETNELIVKGVSQSVIPPGYNTGGAEMFAFTEHGVAMLATVLKSARARTVCIACI